MMKVTACAITIMLLQGTPFSFGVILQFVMMLSVLGFNGESQALTLYIVMDSFGTACNVMSDGAISLVIDTIFKKKATEPLV